MNNIITKARKFVADGVFFSELNELLFKELSKDGYSKVEIRRSPRKIEVIINTTNTQSIIGFKGRRIREITKLIEKRFNLGGDLIEVFVEKVLNRGLCAHSQAESLRYKLLKGLPVRRACYSIVRSTMEAGAKGCIVTVSGKLRAQRAKSMKFMDGYMIHSGKPYEDYVRSATRHCLLQSGVIGVKISIMLPWDPTGVLGPKKPLPDVVTVLEKAQTHLLK
jgi:small subunit ribosomal protein S3e